MLRQRSCKAHSAPQVDPLDDFAKRVMFGAHRTSASGWSFFCLALRGSSPTGLPSIQTGLIPSREVQLKLIDIAPAPTLAGLKRLHDRMCGVMKVLRRMFVFRGIATAHVPALEAQPQMNPTIPHFQTLLTPASARRDLPNLIKMDARFHVLSSHSDGLDNGAQR
jgi:hypothetical protein